MAMTSGAELLNCHDLPSAARKIGSSERGKSSHGQNSPTGMTPTTRPVAPTHISLVDHDWNRRVQATRYSKPTSTVVYLISALSATQMKLVLQRRFEMRDEATSGTTLSSSNVTISASLWALPAVSNCISGFHANTPKPVRRARGLAGNMRPSSHHRSARLTI